MGWLVPKWKREVRYDTVFYTADDGRYTAVRGRSIQRGRRGGRAKGWFVYYGDGSKVFARTREDAYNEAVRRNPQDLRL